MARKDKEKTPAILMQIGMPDSYKTIKEIKEKKTSTTGKTSSTSKKSSSGGTSSKGKTKSTNKTPILDAASRLSAKDKESRATYSSAPKPTKKYTDYNTETKKPTNYSSAVKYLQSKGIQGASGIMTETEWRRRNKTGTYQDYLDSMISKYDSGATVPRTTTSPAPKSDSTGWEIAGNAAMSGLSTFNKGLFSTLDFILPTEFLGKYDFISNLNEHYSNLDNYYKQKKAESLQGKSTATKILADVGEGTVAALPNAVLALMSGGISAAGTTLGTAASSSSGIVSMLGNTARTALKNPMYWTSMAQTLGTDYEEAKANGANEFVASATAIIKSAINAGVEIGGGIETLPSNLKSGDTKLIKNWIMSMFEDGQEEVVQGVVSASVDKLMYDHDKEVVSLSDKNAIINPARMAKEFGMGAAVGGVLGGAQTGVISGANAIARARYGNIVQNEQQTTPEQPSKGQDTLERAARDVVAERNRTSTPLADRLEAQSQNNEQITVADVKKATGFGEEGSKLVAELANRDGVTFSQAERTVKTAYMAGLTNVDSARVSFETDTQIDAYTAGRKDRAMQDLAAKVRAKNAVVYNSVQNNAENDTQTSKVVKAIKNSLRPEIVSNPELMSMLQERFGENGFAEFASDIILTYNQNGSIGEHEALFLDGGEAVYDALAENIDTKFSVNVLNDETNSDIINDDNVIEASYSTDENDLTLYLPTQEYAMLSKAIMEKNAGLADKELRPVDYVYAADGFYVYRNNSFGDFTVTEKFDVETEYERISVLEELIDDGIYTNTDRERLNRLLVDVRSGEGSNTGDNERTENRRATVGNDRVFGEQQRSDTIGYSFGVSENNSSDEVSYSVDADSILTGIEWAQFYNSLGDLERGMWFPQTSDGDYIFETYDKLIFTDGIYTNPKINSVVVFENLNAEEIEYGKEMAYYAAQRGEDSQKCYEAIRDVLGQEHVIRTNPYPDKAYQRSKNSKGKGSDSETANQGSRKDVNYSLDDGDGSQYGVMWTLEEGVLTNGEVSAFYEKVSEAVSSDYKNYRLSQDGDYIFEVGNKLIYSDGDYDFPFILKVIEFDSNISDDVEYAKEVVYSGEEYGYDYSTIAEIAEAVLGKGRVKTTNYNDDATDTGEAHNFGKGKNSGTANQGSRKDVSYLINDEFENEELNNERRDLLSNGSGKRKNSKSPRKPAKKVDGRTSRYREGRGAAFERREYCRTLKAAGNIRQEVIYGHQCEVIPQEYYTDRMKKIAELNKERGIDETVIITGGATLPFVKDSKGNPKTARGIIIKSNGKITVIIQYDNEFAMPEQINDHEHIHNKYNESRTQKIKNIILNSLSVSEKKNILKKLSLDYNGVIEGNEAKIYEEFIANTLSGLNEYTAEFNDLVKAYWNGNDKLIESYKVSEYTESIDSGGSKVVDSVGFIDELSIGNDINIPYDESRQLEEYIMSVNHSNKELKAIGYKEVGNHFYVWENKSKTDYDILVSIDIDGNENDINFLRGEFNDINRRTQRISDDVEKVIKRYGSSSSSSIIDKNGSTNVRNGTIFERKFEGREVDSDRRGNSEQSNRDTSDDSVSYSLAGENTEFWDEWLDKIKEYGAIPSGEKPHRNIQVPRKTGKNKKVSQTVRTILEAKATPDEAVPTIGKMVEDGVFSYDVYTDKQAISGAESYIKEYGWDESLDDWFDAVEKGEVSKQITAMGWALYNNAANIAATTTSETERTTAIKTSLKILDAMVKHQRSAAQALQATRILKSLSPETQLYGVQKSVNALQNELSEKYGDKAPDLQIDAELAEQFITAETAEERAEIEKEIYKDIGRQMPSRFIDKWNAWRYLAMLGNPRTHIRNIVGNAGFAPVVAAKDLTATAIESIVNRVSTKKIVRGKALVTGSKADRTLLKAAWGDYGNVAELISNGGKYNDRAMANQHIEEGRQIFNVKPLEWARKKNSTLLEVEDMWFAQPHYAYALAQYCKANNITAEQIKKGKAIAPAREYAIKEAQKATYRDTNAFSQLVSEWGRSNQSEKNVVKKAFSTVVEGILPFRKTPANILVRGVEYSPLGLIKGLSYDLYKVSKGDLSASEAIDNISAGLTGTGLLAFGVFLAAQGLVRGHGGDDKEEKEFEKLMGHQAYALELPDGQSITLDWLAPEALPFFVGVNLWEATNGSDEEANLSTILQAVSNISEPMLEMSCLQGLNDLFEGIGYASSNDTSGLVSVISSAATSYLMQGIPTVSGQAERTGEEYRMSTYTEKNDFLTGDMQYTLGKASAKIPFWDYHQIPYIDAWGRKEASGAALKRGLNNFLNPAYTSTVETSKMENELLRLYESTGEGGVFPSRADKYFTVDGVRKDLTADEYVKYATLKGQKSYKLVSDLVKSKAYKALDDEEKVKAIDEAYDYANQKAKEAISNYKPEAWVGKADEFGANVGSYISFKANVNGTKENNGGKISKQEVVDIILDMAQNDSDTWKMYLSMYDSTSDMYAYNKGIGGETYMYFLESLNDVDMPTKSGKYGTYTQAEATSAIKRLDGLSRQEKAALWQSVNTSWKRNPFR